MALISPSILSTSVKNMELWCTVFHPLHTSKFNRSILVSLALFNITMRKLWRTTFSLPMSPSIVTFLPLFKKARHQAYSIKSMQNAFRTCGIPLCSKTVMDNLRALKTNSGVPLTLEHTPHTRYVSALSGDRE